MLSSKPKRSKQSKQGPNPSVEQLRQEIRRLRLRTALREEKAQRTSEAALVDALHESEERFRRYFELGLVGMAITSPSKQFIEVNDRYCDLLGYQRDELLKMSWDQFTYPDDLAADVANFNRVIAGECDAYSMDKRYIRKNGQIIHGTISVKALRNPDGSLKYLLGMLDDITHRKHAAAALLESEGRFRTLIEQAPVAIMISRQGTIDYVNPAYVRLFAVGSSEAVAGRPVIERIAPQCRPQILERIRRRELGLPVSEEYDGIGLRPDGSQFPFSGVATVVNLAEGASIVAFYIDMTERKRTAQLLLESEKLRTVAGLAAGVAHEINNPLAGMVQNAQAAINRLTTAMPANEAAARRHGTTFDTVQKVLADREIPEMLEAIRSSGLQASSIIRNLLSYTRSEQSKSTTRLDLVIDRTLELAASDIELRRQHALGAVEIVREFAANPPSVVCHEGQLHQALLNLLRNAVSAMHNNPPTRPPRLILRANSCHGHACIEVEDNGAGIPAEIRSRLFEPFVTTKHVGDGTGLGLFVSYHIVTANHGGRISVQSAANRGTCIQICLPLAKPED